MGILWQKRKIRKLLGGPRDGAYGLELITDFNRYVYEVSQYRSFLSHISRMLYRTYDLEYLSFYIDLLIKEVKYSALLEIQRGNSIDRFIYPFAKFNAVLLDYKRPDVVVEVDLLKNNMISAPWKHERYRDDLRKIKKSRFRYDSRDHRAIYFDYLNMTCAYNGTHSLGIGTYLGEGKVEAEYYDTTCIFPFLDVNPDLSFSYNMKHVKKGENLNAWKKELQTRIYGTDYRMLLIYELSKKKYNMEQDTEK